MKKICVIGSINMDLVTVTNTRPNPGETLIGESFQLLPGGKGANQAVALARLDANTTMLGKVGNDIYGEDLLETLKLENINTEYIQDTSETSTGVATITVSNGENSIIVIPGANGKVDESYINSVEEIITQSDFVVTQLEIPLASVCKIAEICKSNSIPFLLNPAPSMKLPKKLIDNTTYITPNEHEVVEVFGETDIDSLLEKYPNKLIVTEGEKGARFNDGSSNIRIPAIEVEAVDTTGAGDTFNGALAYSLANNKSIKEAIEFAVIAGGLAVTKLGAQSGIPNLSEINNF